MMERSASSIAERIQTLTAEQLAAVDHFMDALQLSGEDTLTRRDFASVSEAAFAAVWDNPEDKIYDTL